MYFIPIPNLPGTKSRTSNLPGTNLHNLILNLPGTNSNTSISNLPGTKTIPKSNKLILSYKLYICSFAFLNNLRHRYTMNRTTHKDISIGLTVFSAFLMEVNFFFFFRFIVSIITRTYLNFTSNFHNTATQTKKFN